MYNFFIKLIVILFSFNLASCFVSGGTKGNFEKYNFEISNTELKEAVEYVVINNGYDFKSDTLYSLKGTGYENFYNNIVIEENGSLFIFEYTFVESTESFSVIALTGAAKFGDVMLIPSKMKKEDKIFFEKIFREKFISKIYNKIGGVPR